MKRPAKKKPYKKIALAFSLCMVILWAVLGTGASLAWFTDTSETMTNIFHFGEFDLEVSHRTKDGKWETIDGKTEVFDDSAAQVTSSKHHHRMSAVDPQNFSDFFFQIIDTDKCSI